MRRFILGALVVIGCCLGTAQAQDFGVQLGVRLEGIPTAIAPSVAAYPGFGSQFGLEARFGAFGVGGRVSLSSFLLLLWRASADVYVSYRLPEGFTLYGGVGTSVTAALFVGGEYTDSHALLGVRLQGGFFVEATPGVAFSRVCTQRDPPTTMDATLRPMALPCYAFADVQILIVGISIGWVWVL